MSFEPFSDCDDIVDVFSCCVSDNNIVAPNSRYSQIDCNC